jgi:hypothetical protein
MSDVNTVLLSTGAYAQIKNENCKYRLLIDNLLSNAELSSDGTTLVFNSEKVSNALQFVYVDDYKKCLATARTRAKRYGVSTKEGIADVES